MMDRTYRTLKAMPHTLARETTRLASVVVAAASLLACVSNPLESEEARQLASERPLPRAIFVEVECQEESYGTETEWGEDIANVLWYLGVSELVRCQGEKVREEFDVKIHVKIEKFSADSDERSVDSRGAMLGVLSWMTVPFLPLWIEDVNVGSGLTVKVSQALRTAAGDWGPPSAETNEISGMVVPTNMLDRYPFLSWPTVGALFVPPFIYQHGNREHLDRSIAERVRLGAAVQIARAIKKEGSDELLKDLQVERDTDGRLIVSGVARRDVSRVALRMGKTEFDETRLSYTRNLRERWEYKIPEDAVAGRYLRIEAFDRDGSMMPYTMRIP